MMLGNLPVDPPCRMFHAIMVIDLLCRYSKFDASIIETLCTRYCWQPHNFLKQASSMKCYIGFKSSKHHNYPQPIEIIS